MIKTDDLDYQKGQVHFTTDSYLEIGKRFADKEMNLFMTPKINNQVH
jgi:hypothetical protein